MNENRDITILHLYPKDMNIYGDWGNILVLKRRLEWHGYSVTLLDYNPGDAFPDDVDIIVGGGGQDNGQVVIQEDLHAISTRLHELAREDTPMLVICGLYQLFGTTFKTQDERIIPGIGLLDVETVAGPERLIGNITTKSDEFGYLVGYENHSGQTILGPKALPLAQVIKGAGNNSKDATEGARYRNIIGSYMHGSLLPKNPQIADFLIQKAVIKKYGEFTENVIDDRFADLARAVAMQRPR